MDRVGLVHFIVKERYWLAGGFLLSFFSSFGQTYFIALFSGDIRREFSLSHGDFGSLYMAATLLSALTLPFLGRLVDFISVARSCVVVFLALIIFTLIMSGASHVAFLFVALYGLRLFGQGMMVHIALTAMGRWYAAQRGRAVSLSSIGLQMGEAVLPILFVTIIASIGWRYSWLIAAALLLVFLPITVRLLKKDRSTQGTAEEPTRSPIHQWTRRQVLGDPYFWLIMSAVLAPSFIMTCIFFHQVHIMEIKNWSLNIFASSFFIMSFATIITSLVFGWLIDRFGALMMLPIILVPLALACFMMAFMQDQAVIFFFMVMFGVSYGASSTLQGTIWPELYGLTHLGSIRSMVVAFMVFATAAGPGGTGILIDRGFGFEKQLIIMGIYCLFVTVVMIGVVFALMRRPASYHP